MNWLRELSRFTVRARGKSMASWHCTVEFHSPCASSFGHTTLTLEDRQTGSGAFRIPFFFFFLKYRRQLDGGGGGGACRIQSVTDRGPNVVNGYKLHVHQKFGRKSVLQFLTSTVKLQSLFAYLMHVPQVSQISILKLFFYLSHFASTTEGSLLGSNFSTREMFTPIFRHA